VSGDYRAGRQIVALTGLERFQRAHAERLILVYFFRIQIAFEAHQETRAGDDCKRLRGQSVPLAIGGMRVGARGRAFPSAIRPG